MAITRVATTKLAAAAGTNLIPTKPAGTVSGDVHILAVGVQYAPAIGDPAGWTRLQTLTPGANYQTVFWWRIDDGSFAAPTITWDGSSVFRWYRWVAYNGAHASTPINQNSGQHNTVTTATTAPAVTPSVADTLLVHMDSPNGACASWTAPAGYTAVDDTANAVFLAEKQLVGGSGVSSGSPAGVLASALNNGGFLAAIGTTAPAAPPAAWTGYRALAGAG